MGGEREMTKMKDLLPEDELVTDCVQQKAENSIGTPTGSIPKSLQRQPFPERAVKEIYKISNLVVNHVFIFAARIYRFCLNPVAQELPKATTPEFCRRYY